MSTSAHPAVLILEPDPLNDRQNMAAGLNKAGCTVELATTVSEGLRLLLQQEFGVVVIDPAISTDSIRFLQHAARIRPWIQIVLTGTGASGKAAREALAAESVCLVERPVAVDVLARIVQEAFERRQQHIAVPDRSALNRMLSDLGTICRLAQVSFGQDATANLLDGLSLGISELVPCTAIGVLDAAEKEPVLRLRALRPVTPAFMERVQEEILTGYTFLTDQPVPKDLIPVKQEGEISATAAANEVGSLFTVPVMSGEALDGMLTFAAVEKDAYSSENVSFLYHVANHLSTVFPTLRRIRHLAARDSLTGLYNRGYFEEELHKTWLLSERYGYPMGLLIMDMDGLRALNERYGHPLADKVIRELAQLMVHTTRNTDTVARYGGDEFAVILPNSNAEQSRNCAERLLAAIAHNVFCKDRQPLSVSVSIGVVTSTDQGIKEEADLITMADQACFLAKESGKAQVCTVPQVLAHRRPGADADQQSSLLAVESAPEGESQGRILVVDDEAAICLAFEAMLTDKGFNVLTETSASKAIELVRARGNDFDVVLTDLRMPEMDGIQLIETIHKICPDMVNLVVTGYGSADDAIAAMRVGAYDLVRKPVDFNDLAFVLKRGVERRNLRRQVEAYRTHIEEMLDDRTRSLRKAVDALQSSYLATMEALSTTLAVRESHTALHNKRVSEYALCLAKHLHVPEEDLVTIRRGGMLHDIGKIGVPDAILQKPGPLNAAEWDVMRQHPVTGYQILNSIPFLKNAAEMVYSHHERYDGTGYPRGLSGEAICLGARLFAVADAFDALRSDRVYRKAVGLDKALQEIQASSGTQFDPAIVAVFMECHEEMDQLYR